MIAGQHTVAELRELLAAKDFDIAAVQDVANAALGPWHTTNPGEATAWGIDWAKLLARYGIAKGDAELAIAAAAIAVLTPDNLIPAESPWRAVLHALTPTPGVLTPDSFQGLVMRLQGWLGHPLDFTGQPQPTSTDADLVAFQATDSALKALPPIPGLNAPDLSTGTKVAICGGIGLAILLVLKLK